MHYANNTGFSKAGYGKKRSFGKSSKVNIINADWKTVPWEECGKIYDDAAQLAEETAQVEFDQQYELYLANCLRDGVEFKPKPPLPNKLAIRRAAGQKAVISDFIPKYKIADFAIHYFPQIVAHIATLSLVTGGGEIYSPGDYKTNIVDERNVSFSRDECDDYISGAQYLTKHWKNPRMMGLYRFLMLDSRSSFLPQQYKGEARAYCSLVPIIMFAYKLHYGISYKAWDEKEARFVMPHNLYEAATANVRMQAGPWEDESMYEYTKEDLLHYREQGLVWKTGEKAGQPRNPLHTHKLFGLGDTDFGKLPELAQVMLTQIWCAHPENRTKYMILCPEYAMWEVVPSTLIATDVTITHDFSATTEVNDLPWEG